MEQKRKNLLKKLSEARFAQWETHIFLDTHPNNLKALENLKKFAKLADELQHEFEKEFGPISSDDIYGLTSFDWISNPWPWEKEAN